MAVLEKIRVKFGLAVSIIIALALLSFIIDPGTLQTAVQTMSSKYDVGKINGKSISFTDFSESVENLNQITELLTGTTANTEEAQKSLRDAAWQSLVDKYLFVKNAKDAGFVVGDDEVVDLTTGANPSPVIAQIFMDETGNFDSQAVVDFVRSISDDATGRYKSLWNYIQNSVYTQQFYDKYDALFTYSDLQTPLMLKKAIEENNTTANVDFVMVPYTYDLDTTVVITDAEIKAYYDAHKKFYKQQNSRDIEYVVFEVIPSENDVNATLDSVNENYEEFSTTDNMRSFLAKNSDRSYSEYWNQKGEFSLVSPDVEAFVFADDTKTGDVSPVYKYDNTFYVARIMDTQNRADSVYVKHILLAADQTDLADSLVTVIKGGKADFAALAAEYSLDTASSYDGNMGTIGWMTQNYMINGMESVLDANLNEPFIINTIYGKHVVLVTDKTNPVLMKQVAVYQKESLASKETFNDYYSQANRFATLASGGYNDYRAAVDSVGVYSHPIGGITEATDTYGSIDSAKEITRWAFDAKKNDVSGIITVNNNYFFVVALKDIHKEGIIPLQDMDADIRSTLYFEKAGEKSGIDVAQKIKGLTTMEEVAEALNTSISSNTGVAFSSLATQGLDPKFVGAIASAPVNKICGPVVGTIGTYVFQVTSRDTGAFYTEDDANNLKLQTARYNAQMIIPAMEDASNYKDNRARFY